MILPPIRHESSFPRNCPSTQFIVPNCINYTLSLEPPLSSLLLLQQVGEDLGMVLLMVSYPQQKLTLGAVKFRPVPEQDKVEQKYVIRYTIYTDKGVSRADNLTMKVIWTDKDPIIG